jgi:hypothetical protein
MKKRLALPIVMLIVFSLAACNLPNSAEATETPISIDAAFTAAAQTVEAQFTANALTQAAVTPLASNTPLPPASTNTSTPAPITNTALPKPINTQSCDSAQFVSDVTVPDNTNFNPGDTFTKTWRVKNIGTCSWTPSYALIFGSDGSSQMNGPSSVALTGNVNPGDSVDLSVNLTAPGTAGTYTGNWKLRNAAGLSFGFMYVKITVGGGGTGTGTGTATPTGAPAAFAVTHIDYTTSGGCTSALTVIAQVQVNSAGTVGYHWVYSDGATDTDIHPALVYSAAGTQSVTTTWDTTGSGTKWIAVYIDDPNHQQIGKAEFTCP